MLKKICTTLIFAIVLLSIGCISHPVSKKPVIKKASKKVSSIYIDRTGLIQFKNDTGDVLKEFFQVENVYMSFFKKTSVRFSYPGDGDILSEYIFKQFYLNIEDFTLDFIGLLKNQLDVNYSPESFLFEFDEDAKFTIVCDKFEYKQ